MLSFPTLIASTLLIVSTYPLQGLPLSPIHLPIPLLILLPRRLLTNIHGLLPWLYVVWPLVSLTTSLHSPFLLSSLPNTLKDKDLQKFISYYYYIIILSLRIAYAILVSFIFDNSTHYSIFPSKILKFWHGIKVVPSIRTCPWLLPLSKEQFGNSKNQFSTKQNKARYISPYRDQPI